MVGFIFQYHSVLLMCPDLSLSKLQRQVDGFSVNERGVFAPPLSKWKKMPNYCFACLSFSLTLLVINIPTQILLNDVAVLF
jgi:hypothetical protein